MRRCKEKHPALMQKEVLGERRPLMAHQSHIRRGLKLLHEFHTFTHKSGLKGRHFFSSFIPEAFPTVLLLGSSSGLSLVVGLVLYISSINDEMLNRTKDSDTFFNYKYGWSFAFSAISFLLTEVCSSPHIPVKKQYILFLGQGSTEAVSKKRTQTGFKDRMCRQKGNI